MPSSLPPEEQAKVPARTPAKSSKVFDPDILDRSVIAIPLLEKIEKEVEQIEWVRKNRPDLMAKFNCAVIYDPNYRGGSAKAFERANELLADAKEKTKTAGTEGTIEPPERQGEVECSFAQLNSRLARKLIALNSDLRYPPILRIVPSRF